MSDDQMTVHYVAADSALAHATALLVAHGLPERDAATVAGALVRADLRGVDTHGLSLLAEYLERLRGRQKCIHNRGRQASPLATSTVRTGSDSSSRREPWTRR